MLNKSLRDCYEAAIGSFGPLWVVETCCVFAFPPSAVLDRICGLPLARLFVRSVLGGMCLSLLRLPWIQCILGASRRLRNDLALNFSTWGGKGLLLYMHTVPWLSALLEFLQKELALGIQSCVWLFQSWAEHNSKYMYFRLGLCCIKIMF